MFLCIEVCGSGREREKGSGREGCSIDVCNLMFANTCLQSVYEMLLDYFPIMFRFCTVALNTNEQLQMTKILSVAMCQGPPDTFCNECVAVCCSVLQCVAVCCKNYVVQIKR